MPSTEPSRASNRLIQCLPRRERATFLSHCTAVDLASATVVTEPGDRIRHVYFPTSVFISMIMPVDRSDHLEAGLIGNEGMLGASLIAGVDRSPLQARVQGPGEALIIDARRFRDALESSAVLRRVLQRYVHVLMCQLAQSAACVRHHVVQARLARWLLMCHDRAQTANFHMTHECLAFLLGVRRVGVTRAATALQNGKLIGYHRGDIMVLDRAGLEAASCSCYAADRRIYAQTMTRGAADITPAA